VPFPALVPAANHLVAALPSRDRALLLASGEKIDLVFATTLIEPGSRIRHIYFPTGPSYISLLTPVDGASGLEVGLVGNEGECGVSSAIRAKAARFVLHPGWMTRTRSTNSVSCWTFCVPRDANFRRARCRAQPASRAPVKRSRK
jgi:hypothetical protein